MVIALTHNQDPRAFAAELRGVDAVVAGHEHIAINETVTAADGRSVAVVEAASSPSVAYFGSIGLLSIDVERNAEGDFEVVGHDARQVSTADVARANDKIDALTAALVEENAKVLDQVIGTSSRAYEYAPSSAEAPGGWELVRTEDTPIGHVVTSAYLAQTGVDLAFENAGGIRGGIPAGDVTAGESSARARHMRGGVARAYRTGWLGADDGEPVGFGDVCDRRGFGRRRRRYGRRLGGCGRRLRLGVACLARYGQCGGVRSGGAACVRGGFKPRCRCRCFAPCPPRALARCELAGSRHADAMSADASRTLFSALQAFAVSRRPLLLLRPRASATSSESFRCLRTFGALSPPASY